MIAEIKESPAAALATTEGTIDVPVTVEITAADPPTGDPTFNFQGLDTRNSVWITSEAADFTLTLSPEGFPEGWSVTYDTTGPGPITWLSPGPEQPVPRPDYISEPLLDDSSTVLTFTDTNTATVAKQDLVSFKVNIVITPPGGASMRFNSLSHTVSSPDPTIINVDPPGSGN
ncbi:MAG TPA: hypothetical protein VII86_03150 [Thermoanaerobaculia bacterium]|jgi:hypothetical protein